MYLNLSKYFLLFIMFSLFSYGAVNAKKLAKDVEVKDTIVVHGMVLYGQVTAIGPEKLSFKLLYSDGINHIAYKDIESIDTQYNYHISFKRMDIEGRVVGIEDSTYIKVMEGENQRTIKIADIDNFVISESDDPSFENRLRNKFPYTRGNISVGLKREHGINKENEIDIQVELGRKQAEHEVQLFVDYSFETTQTENKPKELNEDELLGMLTYKNHFTNNEYFYGALMGDYDRPRHIKSRFAPAAGYGYRFKYGKSKWFEPSIGLAYITTKYTGDTYADKNFAAAALKLEGKYQFDDLRFINTLIVNGHIMYFPSLSGIDDDWISRARLNLAVPVFDFLSVKFVWDWVNDSNPDPSVGNNKITSRLLFGFDF